MYVNMLIIYRHTHIHTHLATTFQNSTLYWVGTHCTTIITSSPPGVSGGRLQFLTSCISQCNFKDINFAWRYCDLRYGTFCFSPAYMTFRSLKRSSIALEIVKENKLVDNTYYIQKVSLFN